MKPDRPAPEQFQHIPEQMSVFAPPNASAQPRRLKPQTSRAA